MKPEDFLSPHFRLAEFLHNGSMEGVTTDVILNLRKLANILELIREVFGKPIIITSGFRTILHNAQIKGSAKGSQHLYGLAADFRIEGLSPKFIQAKLAQLKDKIGFCLEITNGDWTHIDLRPEHIVFENLGGGKYKTLNVVGIKDFVRKYGVAA